LQVRQLRHLERFRQTTGHASCTVALRRMGLSNYVMTENRKIRSWKYDDNWHVNSRRIITICIPASTP